MITEATVFFGFCILQITFVCMEKLGKRFPSFKIVAKFHYLVWLGHPVVVHTVKDYAIHFVIYSGKIISAH